MNSIKLAARCYNQGLLSKEALEDILRVRERLIKQAIAEKVASTRFFGKVREAGKATGGFYRQVKHSLGLGGGLAKPGKATTKEGIETITTQPQLGWAPMIGNLIKLLGAGVALQAGASAVTGLASHRKDKKLRGQIEKSYGKMIQEYPKLQEMDRGKVSRHFGVLARYAPSLAADPMVAGSWVQSTAQMGYIDTDAIKRLSDTQTAIDKAHEDRALIRPGQFGKGIALAQGAMGGGG